jgi:hypothetical protein
MAASFDRPVTRRRLLTSARSFASKAFSAATRSRFSPTAAALLMDLAFRQEKLNRREQPGGKTVSRVHHQ